MWLYAIVVKHKQMKDHTSALVKSPVHASNQALFFILTHDKTP